MLRWVLQRGTNDKFCLIKTALPEFRGVQRDRYDQHVAAFEAGSHVRGHFAEHAAEHIRDRAHTLILEQVNELAQTRVVAAVRGDALEWRLHAAPQSTAH